MLQIGVATRPRSNSIDDFANWVATPEVIEYLTNIARWHEELDRAIAGEPEVERQKLLYADIDSDDDIPKPQREEIERTLNEIQDNFYFFGIFDRASLYGQVIFYLYRAAAEHRGLRLHDLEWRNELI